MEYITTTTTTTTRDRKKYIGSTDVAPIVGLCKYRNSINVFNQKLGITPEKDATNAMKMGIALEPLILKMCEESLGIKIVETQVHARHDVYDFLGATCDAIAIDQNGEKVLVEAKSSRFGTDFGSDRVPDQYMIQVQYLMGLHKLTKCIICVLIGGQELKTYEVAFDENMFKKLVYFCVEFWQKNVLMETPPNIERKINPELPSEIIDVYNKIKLAQERIKKETELLDALKEQFDVLTENQLEIKSNNILIAKKTIAFRETLDKKELGKVVDLSAFTKKVEYKTTRFY